MVRSPSGDSPVTAPRPQKEARGEVFHLTGWRHSCKVRVLVGKFKVDGYVHGRAVCAGCELDGAGIVTDTRKTRRIVGTVTGTALWLVVSATAGAAESDLISGLAHLRAGAQAQAETDLLRYRDGLRNSDARRSIDRVLPLLRRPLSEDVRDYIAATIEESVRPTADARARSARPGFLSRMFPVFP